MQKAIQTLEVIPPSAYKRGIIGIEKVPCRVKRVQAGFQVETPVLGSSRTLGLNIFICASAATKKAAKREAAKGVIGLYVATTLASQAQLSKKASTDERATHRLNRRIAQRLNPYIKLEPSRDAKSEDGPVFRGDLSFNFAIGNNKFSKATVTLGR